MQKLLSCSTASLHASGPLFRATQLRGNRAREAPALCRTSCRGAILPIAIFFFLILSAGLFVVFNTGQVTQAKRQLTNAADAIAMSNATIVAEGLNYTSYTNRAIVANYQAVGQMTSMWSIMGMSDWYWRDSTKLLKGIGELTKFIPEIGGVISSIIDGFTKFSEKFWQPVVYGVRLTTQMMANVGVSTLSLTNYTIFASQQVHLASTIAALPDMAQKLLKANTVNAEYVPSTIAYQSVKGIYDLVKMLAIHRPVGSYLGSSKMATLDAPKEKTKFNLVHQLMTEEMNKLNSSPTGRRLLPNAVGLWMTDGCDLSHSGAILSGIESNGMQSIVPALGSVPGIQIIESTIGTIANLLGQIGGVVMCMYNRTGGSQVIQMQDGTYGWAGIDAMQMQIFPTGHDGPDENTGALLKLPIAGGVVMSRVGSKNASSTAEIPPDLEAFAHTVENESKWKKSYFGQGSGSDDCIYLVLPNAQLYEPRLSGACLSAGAGNAKKYYNRGIFQNITNDLAWRAMKGSALSRNSSANISQAAVGALEPLLSSAEQTLADNVSVDSSLASEMAPELSDNGSILGGLPAGMPAIDASLASPAATSAEEASLAARIVAQGGQMAQGAISSVAGVPGIASGILGSLISGGITSGTGNLDGPNAFLKFFLKLIGAEDLIDVLSGRISDGTETLFQKGAVGADLGIPFEKLWLWEMRKASPGNYALDDLNKGNIALEDLQVQNAALQDNGPSFLTALRIPLTQVKTANTLKLASGRLKMDDYDTTTTGTAYIQTAGKARVYYRAPVEHWSTRGQLDSHANLMLPYWNARLEGLNYGEKILLAGLS